ERLPRTVDGDKVLIFSAGFTERRRGSSRRGGSSRQSLLDDLRLDWRRGLLAGGPGPGHHFDHRKAGQAAERQHQNHFVVPETLAALDQTEVPDQAVLSAAHSS